MAFHDVQFPVDISQGSEGGPGFKTNIIDLDSGQEERVALWANPKHRYNVGYGLRKHSDVSNLKTFYIARRGAANSFRYKDWSDYNSTQAGFGGSGDGRDGGQATSWNDQLIGQGDGGKTQFQLVKRYISGAVSVTREITKPIASTIRVGVNGVELTTGWSIDATTGIITFTSAPGNGVDVEWGGEFDVHCRFGEGSDELLNLIVEDFGSANIPSIELVEILEADALSDEFYHGGSVVETLSANRSISESEARLYQLDPDGSNYDIILPTVDSLSPGGGPWFIINNSGGSGSLVLKDQDGNTVETIAFGETKQVALVTDGSNATWLVW